MRAQIFAFGQLLAATLALAPWSSASAACAGESWISLEIVAGEVAGNVLAEFVEIDRQGCVVSYYADFDLRAGLYERQLSAGDRQSLADHVADNAIVALDMDAVRAGQTQRALPIPLGGLAQVHHVADADRVTIRIRDRGSERVIEWPSPEIYAELIPEDAQLQKLAAFVKRIRAEGADTRRTQSAGGRP